MKARMRKYGLTREAAYAVPSWSRFDQQTPEVKL